MSNHVAVDVGSNGGTIWVGRRDGDRFELDVTVPWNATATVRLPGDGDPDHGGPDDVTVDGVSVLGDDATLPDGVESATVTDDGVAVEVGAGTYSFERHE